MRSPAATALLRMSPVRALIDAPQEDAALGLVVLNCIGDLVPDILIARPLGFGDPGAEYAALLQQRHVLLAECQKEFFLRTVHAGRGPYDPAGGRRGASLSKLYNLSIC